MRRKLLQELYGQGIIKDPTIGKGEERKFRAIIGYIKETRETADATRKLVEGSLTEEELRELKKICSCVKGFFIGDDKEGKEDVMYAHRFHLKGAHSRYRRARRIEEAYPQFFHEEVGTEEPVQEDLFR